MSSKPVQEDMYLKLLLISLDGENLNVEKNLVCTYVLVKCSFIFLCNVYPVSLISYYSENCNFCV